MNGFHTSFCTASTGRILRSAHVPLIMHGFKYLFTEIEEEHTQSFTSVFPKIDFCFPELSTELALNNLREREAVKILMSCN